MPKFYLTGFAAGSQIVTVRLPGHQRFTQSVGDGTVAKDFYTVEGHEDGSDVVEASLSEVEGVTASVFKAIADGIWPLSADDRMTLAYFVALQATRVPAQRRTADYIAQQLLRLQVGAGGKSGLRQQLEQQGRDATDDLVERMWSEATRSEGPPIRRSKAEHILQMIELADELLKYIAGRPWTVVRFGRRSLITSDAPVGLVREPETEPWHGVGYLTAWGVTFPLTRKLGLLMGSPQPVIDAGVPVERIHHGVADRIQPGTTRLEKFFNCHTVANASEWLFHHPEDGAFVPEKLPDPRTVTIEMSGTNRQFDGQPWFKAATGK